MLHGAKAMAEELRIGCEEHHVTFGYDPTYPAVETVLSVSIRYGEDLVTKRIRVEDLLGLLKGMGLEVTERLKPPPPRERIKTYAARRKTVRAIQLEANRMVRLKDTLTLGYVPAAGERGDYVVLDEGDERPVAVIKRRDFEREFDPDSGTDHGTHRVLWPRDGISGDTVTFGPVTVDVP